MNRSLKKLCGAGALLLPLSVWAQDNSSLYDQTATQQTTASGSLALFNQLQDQQQVINSLRGQIEDLQHQISQVQSDGQKQYLSLSNRVSALENGGSQQGDDAGSSSDASGGQGTADQKSGGDANQANGSGEAAAGASSNGTSSGGTSTAGNSAQQSYQKAFNYVKQHQYSQAVTAFDQFRKQYPQSPLVGNAYYWLGEIHYQQSQMPDAASAYQALIAKYPHNDKVPDATYRLALIKARQGDVDTTEKLLNSVIKEHPKSQAAQKAKTFLAKING